MEGGFIITPKQADVYSKDQPMIQKLRWADSPAIREKVFFALYKRDGVTYIIADDKDDLSDFIKAGVLKDVRDKGVSLHSSGSHFYSFIKSLQFNEEEKIRRCNDLRQILYLRTKGKIRSCGPELESLLSRQVYSRCHEMVGLYEEGTYYSTENVRFERTYYEGIDENFDDFIQIDSSNNDSGQKKLAAVFDGFVMARDVIYIGSSPGDTWINLMDKYPTIRVFSFDPRPLRMKHDRVEHHQMMVESSKDILQYLENDKRYDLVWDVRGDYESDDEYERMVTDEINLLNSLMVEMKDILVRVNIKIRLLSLHEYFLYGGGRFFVMPYTVERKKTELRYVARVGPIENFSDGIQTGIRTWMDDISNKYHSITSAMSDIEIRDVLRSAKFTYSNFNLWMNSKLMRLDVANYIDTKRIDSDIDINLFSVNRNSPVDMSRYFKNFYPVICSYFLPKYLNRDEYIMTDYECLDFLTYSIYDSRVFIKKMIPGLRMIIPKRIDLMSNELTTSDSFRLQQSYDLVLSNYSSIQYIEAKSKAAESIGFCYKKFPQPFSVMDNMISVSGHMLRFSYMCLTQKDSSFLTYCDKILYNFSQNKCIKKDRYEFLMKEGNKFFEVALPKYLVEKKSNEFWHSIDEWKTGLIALKFLLGEKYHFSIDRMLLQLSDLFDKFIEKTSLLGHENFHYRKITNIAKLEKLKTYKGRVLLNAKQILDLVKEVSPEFSTNDYGKNFLYPMNVDRPTIECVLIKTFRVDISVRFIHIVMSLVRVMSQSAYGVIWIALVSVVHWKKLIYLANTVFYKRTEIKNIWTDEDKAEFLKCDFIHIFSLEWHKVDIVWKNEYYYLFRALTLILPRIPNKCLKSIRIPPLWRKTYDTNWLDIARCLGLDDYYIEKLRNVERTLDDDPLSLMFDSEIIYKSSLSGMIIATP